MLSAAAVAFATFFATIATMVIAMMLVVLALTLVCLLAASQLQRLLGVTGMHVITRVFGVLLCALAVQFVFDGVMQSGLFGTPG